MTNNDLLGGLKQGISEEMEARAVAEKKEQARKAERERSLTDTYNRRVARMGASSAKQYLADKVKVIEDYLHQISEPLGIKVVSSSGTRLRYYEDHCSEIDSAAHTFTCMPSNTEKDPSMNIIVYAETHTDSDCINLYTVCDNHSETWTDGETVSGYGEEYYWSENYIPKANSDGTDINQALQKWLKRLADENEEFKNKILNMPPLPELKIEYPDGIRGGRGGNYYKLVRESGSQTIRTYTCD